MFNNFKFHEIPVAGPPELNFYELALSKRAVRRLTAVNIAAWGLWTTLFFSSFVVAGLISDPSPPMNVDVLWNLLAIILVASVSLLLSMVICTAIVTGYVFRDRLTFLWIIANVLPLPIIFFLSLMMFMVYGDLVIRMV